MFQLAVTDKYGSAIQHLSQWDKNLILYIKNWGYDTVPSIHFFNRNMKNALVVSAELAGDELIKTNLPNVLLETPCPIVMCAYLEESDGLSRTVFTYEIPVRPRAKPDDYEYSNTNTSDATATASDILTGKTAYANGTKITGIIPLKGAATITPGTSEQIISAGRYLSGTQTILGDVNLVASNIKSGVSIFGVSGSYVGSGTGGTDTSDATATAADIAQGKTAYVNGSKITGTHECSEGVVLNVDRITATDDGEGNVTIVEDELVFEELNVTENGEYTPRSGIDGFSKVIVNVDDSGIDMSIDGTLQTGTAPSSVISGTTTSATVDTGLNTINYIVLYKTPSTIDSTGLVQCAYSASSNTAVYTYCSSYSSSSQSFGYAITTDTFTVDGGKFTWSGTGTAAFVEGDSYEWHAFGC